MSDREARERTASARLPWLRKRARDRGQALRLCAGAAWVAACFACSAPVPDARPRAAADAPPSSNVAPASEPWFTLRVRDVRTQEPIAEATVARARAKSWEELNADVEATWSRLGISGSAGSWLGLSREEALPSEPGTQDTAPFAPRDESVIATSNRDGTASIATKIPDDEYLVIRSAGRAPRYVAVQELAKLERHELEIDLHRLGKLSVRVHTLEADPIEDAYLRVEAVPFLPEYRLQLARPLIDGLDWNGPTGSKGEFELADLPFDEGLIVTPLSRCIGKSATVVLTPGETAASCDLIVVAPGGVSGRLVDVAGRPMAGARVDCVPRWPWSSMSVSATTDEEGNFSLGSLPSGSQLLHCTPEYRGGYGMMSEHPLEVEIEPFSRTSAGDLAWGENSKCSGRIVGLPPAIEGEFNRTRFELVQDRARFYPDTLEPDGSFRLFARPGEGKLLLLLDTDWDSGRPILERTVSLPCDGIELDVESSLATLAFRLDAGAGEQLASVTLYDHEIDDPDGSPAWEGALSRFEFDRDGERYVLKTLLPGKFRLELQMHGGARSWVGDVELEAGKTRDLGTLAPGTAKLTGTLQGAPPGSVVDLVRRVPGMFGKGAFGDLRFDHRTAQVAADQSFQFDELPAGLWCATAMADGAAILEPVLVDLHVGDAKQLALRSARAGRVHCRVRNGATPVIGAVLSYSFARVQSLRPFFELNRPLTILPSGRDGTLDAGTFYPGPYRIDVELGDRKLCHAVDIRWGEPCDLDFDFGAPEFTLELDLPDDLLAQLYYVEYLTMGATGANVGLRVPATRTGLRTFSLCAPVSRGYAWISFKQGHQSSTLPVLVELREDRRRVPVSLPPGEVAVRVGTEAEPWSVPNVQVVELGGEKLRATDLWLSTLPMQQLADGRWLARGVTPGATVRILPGDQRPRFGPPARLAHFESGRLEISWP